MLRKAGVYCLSLLLFILPGCGGSSDVEFIETVEIIPLPENTASMRLAHQIGTEVYDEIGAIVASNPEKFDPREVAYQINWGRLEDLDSGSFTFYIKIVGKSAAPFEQEPRIQELMQTAVELVYEKIQVHSRKTTTSHLKAIPGNPGAISSS